MEMFKHKKFQAALIASLIALFGGYSTGLAESGDFAKALAFVDWMAVAAPWGAAILGQGIADFGKEKEKVKAELEALKQ